MNVKKIFISSFITSMLVMTGTTNSFALQNGWVKTGTYWNYYKNGKKVINSWLKSNNKWYAFNEDGEMIKNGLFTVSNDKNYLLDLNGTWVSKPGWKYIKENGNDYWYYINKDGTSNSNNWKKINNKWYYFYSDGYMIADRVVSIKNIRYTFGTDGALITKKGWHLMGKSLKDSYQSWTYTNNSGESLTDKWVYEKGNWFYLDYFGEMTTNSITSDGYFSRKDGTMYTKTGWVKNIYGESTNRWSYFTKNHQIVNNQWYSINGKWYYFDSRGLAEDKFYRSNDKIYIFNSDSTLHEEKGWVYNSNTNKWYYTNTDGTAVTGWFNYNGKTYYLDRFSGTMVTGYEYIDGKYYNFNNNGELID